MALHVGRGVSIQTADMPKVGRVMRRPQHSFHIRQKPFIIQPFMIAPVLAGETMKSLLLQSRVVSDPIKNALIGWWQEYYFFYVKLTDIDEANGTENTQATSLVSMLLNNPSWSPASHPDYQATSSPDKYRHTNSMDYISGCMKVIVRDWFRNEDEAWNLAAGLLSALPMASVAQTNYMDSLTNAAAIVRPDINVDINANATITASEVDEALRRWQWARSTGLTDMSYEDYLSSFGINTEVDHIVGKSELIRYVRQWTYPTNTVEPTTGVPSSACSWSIQERADKDRFFKEPGFLCGFSVTRPKVYFKNLTGAAANELDRALDWLPAHLRADAWSAMKQWSNTTGPVTGIADAGGYWLDIRDLFMYGDQFTNVALSDVTINLVSLPSSTGGKRYVTSADVDGLFVNAAGGKNMIRQDGVVNLAILGSQRDYTGTT